MYRGRERERERERERARERERESGLYEVRRHQGFSSGAHGKDMYVAPEVHDGGKFDSFLAESPSALKGQGIDIDSKYGWLSSLMAPFWVLV